MRIPIATGHAEMGLCVEFSSGLSGARKAIGGVADVVANVGGIVVGEHDRLDPRMGQLDAMAARAALMAASLFVARTPITSDPSLTGTAAVAASAALLGAVSANMSSSIATRASPTVSSPWPIGVSRRTAQATIQNVWPVTFTRTCNGQPITSLPC